MADTILGGKLTVYYLDDNRRKQIRWTGTIGKDDVQKQINVYDACEDLFTDPTQQNDGLIYSAETPGEYTIGKIDAGEIDPWFIDLKTMEHIIGDYANFTGCALKSTGWTRVQDSNSGIVVVQVLASSNNIVVGDIGEDITHADADAGTLLDVVITGGTNDYLFIRPDSYAAANNWDSVTGAITEQGSSKTAAQTAAAVTGEMVWGNPYTDGALLTDTHIYLYQDGERVTSSDETDQDWWIDGNMDRAVPIKDYTASGFPLIDEGYLTVKANQYASKFAYKVVRMNTTSGGNVSAGVSSGVDSNNTTGYASITISGGTGNWTVGDEISGDVSGARAIITKIDNPGATATLHYYYIGDPLTAFNGTEAISNEDDTGAATGSSSVSAQGPALTSWFDGSVAPTYTFANAQDDIDDDGTDEEYAVTIDLNQCSLAQMHEWNKYEARRGSLTDFDGLAGEEWIGLDLAIEYSAFTATIAEGDIATGATSGATAVVVSFPGGTNTWMLLRNTRGTFTDNEIINFTSGGNMSAAQVLTVEVVVPVAESSFGTLAGVNFFGSRAVLLTDYKSAEANLFEVIDATGVKRTRPTSISMTILNLKQYDWASCWRLTASGGVVNKSEYSATGGESIGDTTITVDGTIDSDVPGKTLGGSLFIRDVSDSNKEYVVRFSSYVASTGVITLDNVDIASLTGGDTNTLNETGAFSGTKVGDLVYNHDLTEISYVFTVTSNDSVEISPAFSVDPTGDHVELNCVPIAIDTADEIHFTIIFEFMESDGSASASMQYVAPIYARVVVRNIAAAAEKIKGFTSDVDIGSGGGSASTTRIENTVYGS